MNPHENWVEWNFYTVTLLRFSEPWGWSRDADTSCGDWVGEMNHLLVLTGLGRDGYKIVGLRDFPLQIRSPSYSSCDVNSRVPVTKC